MELPVRSLEEIVEQLQPLPSDWVDEAGIKTISAIQSFLAELPTVITPESLEEILALSEYYLDVIRLFMGLSQDEFATSLRSEQVKGGYSSVRTKLKNEVIRKEIVQRLIELDIIFIIDSHRNKNWTLSDVLAERYQFQRGRAIKGQQRGRSLENAIESMLIRIGVPYVRSSNFISRSSKTAKFDFAIPSADRPKIIIEAKGFEATGSKQTDVLGDIVKIVEAKTSHMYFFIVTDGRGWLNRLSDLKKIVEFHQRGDVDMIYTLSTLHELEEVILHITTYE